MSSPYDDVRIIALQLLKRIPEPTHADVVEKIGLAMSTAGYTAQDLDVRQPTLPQGLAMRRRQCQRR